MLKGISPAVSPELLKVLAEMGHGDEIVVSDAHFPAHSFNGRVLRADGVSAATLLAGIVPLFELDAYATPVAMMAPVPGDTLDPAVEAAYRQALGYDGEIERVERFAFYERAKKAYAVLVTGETAKYGNVILKKGVTPLASAPGGACGGCELSGIETIARGVAVRDGKLLLCRAKGGKTSYLPGGHIEFGETGREALVREMKEETGLDCTAERFMGVVENSFMQDGRRHCEINLVYAMAVGPGEVEAKEDWIEFEWCALSNLDSANILPSAFARLAAEGLSATFAP